MKVKHFLHYGAVAVVFTVVGIFIADMSPAERVRKASDQLQSTVLEKVADKVSGDTRERVLIEHPSLISRVMEGGSFGGKFSPNIARHMFSRDFQPAIDDAHEMTTIEPVGERMWLVRMPIVNSAVFETDAGLVVVDTGMAPAGPALLAAIRSVSDKPVHTIILTHGHVDHAYGTYALMEDSPEAEVIAHENIIPRFERYLKLPASLAHYMSQPLSDMPRDRSELVWPDRVFSDRLEINIGGEQFVLQHRKGETDDQLYVWVPGRKALASADYYQGFLPNAGNGKRVQRYVEEWAFAMREMVALQPHYLLPAHGEAIVDPDVISNSFLALAETFETITEQTLAGLNKGLRKDLIVDSINLPEHLASHPTLEQKYVSPADISKMLLKQYSGWWNDIPSHWSPANYTQQSEAIVGLAGGVEALVTAAYEAKQQDIVIASHMADWAWMAEPEHPQVQQLVIDVYRERILDPSSNTQEILAYLDQMAQARERQLSTVQ